MAAFRRGALRLGFILQSFERRERSFAFRRAFALAATTSKFTAFVKDRTLEVAIVVRPAGERDFIARRRVGFGLKHLLQFAFGIAQIGQRNESAERVVKATQYKFARGFVATVHENRAGQCLINIRERRCAFADAYEAL